MDIIKDILKDIINLNTSHHKNIIKFKSKKKHQNNIKNVKKHKHHKGYHKVIIKTF